MPRQAKNPTRWRLPETLIAEYVRVWRTRNTEMRNALRTLYPELRRILQRGKEFRPDGAEEAAESTEPIFRLDGVAEDVDAEVQRLQTMLGLGPLFDHALAEAIAARLAVGVAGFHAREFSKASTKAIGIDLIGAEPWLQDHLRAFIRENTARMRTYPEEELEQLRRLILQRFREGTRASALASEIAEHFSEYAKRSEFLAKDQILRLHSQLHHLRMRSAEITHAFWSTSKDELVRKFHRALEGVRYALAGPPPIVNPQSGRRALPGQDRACRCVAIPDFAALVKGGAGEARQDARESGGRVVITGVPRAGKTTLARMFGEAFSTDDLIGEFEWSGVSAEVARMFDRPGPWIIEGVAAARALRKWLEAHPDGVPADVVLWFPDPAVDLTEGQTAMAAGQRTIWGGVVGELERRGVQIQTVRPGATW